MARETQMPLVSVVMVNFNGGDLAVDAAAACLRSTVPVELRVADNGSIDGSLSRLRDLAASQAAMNLTEQDRNLGFAGACNREIAAAKGDYLLLLNPDCLLAPDTLERMIAVLEAHPEAGMAGCRVVNPDGSEQRGCRRTLPTLGSGLGRAFRLEGLRARLRRDSREIDLHLQPPPPAPIHVEAISGAFMLVRRRALDEVGPLDEGYFLHCEDLDWCKRFGQRGWKVLFVPEVKVVHHQGTCSNARPIRVEWYKHRGMLRYYRKFLAADKPIWMGGVVWCGVWLRFALISGRTLFDRQRH